MTSERHGHGTNALNTIDKTASCTGTSACGIPPIGRCVDVPVTPKGRVSLDAGGQLQVTFD